MAVTPYIFDGAALGAALTDMGTAAPALTKRIIKSASLINTTAAPIAGTVAIVNGAGTLTITHISARPIAAGETYPCFELINKGVNPGGKVQAMGAGLTFTYTAIDIV
jgi:hypothetical protein